MKAKCTEKENNGIWLPASDHNRIICSNVCCRYDCFC